MTRVSTILTYLIYLNIVSSVRDGKSSTLYSNEIALVFPSRITRVPTNAMVTRGKTYHKLDTYFLFKVESLNERFAWVSCLVSFRLPREISWAVAEFDHNPPHKNPAERLECLERRPNWHTLLNWICVELSWRVCNEGEWALQLCWFRKVKIRVTQEFEEGE